MPNDIPALWTQFVQLHPEAETHLRWTMPDEEWDIPEIAGSHGALDILEARAHLLIIGICAEMLPNHTHWDIEGFHYVRDYGEGVNYSAPTLAAAYLKAAIAKCGGKAETECGCVPCSCACHSSPVMHVQPCCRTCPSCGKTKRHTPKEPRP